MKSRYTLSFLLIPLVALIVMNAQVMAQSDDQSWVTPVNLSQSGAASSPAIVSAPDGTLRVFWWDEFDGLMVAGGPVSALLGPGDDQQQTRASTGWSAPVNVPIPVPGWLTRSGQDQLIDTMPRIVADARGQAHAFWLGEADRDSGNRPILYSRLAHDSTAWTSPTAVVAAAHSFDVATTGANTVHLVYVQPTQAGDRPSGLYYERSRDAGAGWSSPRLVSDSLYLRLLSNEESPLRLTADSQDSVYVTWTDPRSGRVLLAHTSDGGTRWETPRPYTAADGNPMQTQVAALPGGPETLLWRPGNEQGAVVTASDRVYTLALAYWQDDQRIATRQVSLRFQDPTVGEPLILTYPQLTLASSSSGQASAADTLTLAGLDQKGDVWVAGIKLAELEHMLALSPDDLPPYVSSDEQETAAQTGVNLSRGGAASNPIVVTMPGDTLRAFWWDGFDGLTVADGSIVTSSMFTGTEEILTATESWSEPRWAPLPVAATPRILADDMGRVHAFWLQGQGSQQAPGTQEGAHSLVYSQMAADATTWLPPVTLAESATNFDVTIDISGTLHVAYVQTVDTPSSLAGVYYRRTEEGGPSWLPPVGLDQSRYTRLLSADGAQVRLAADDASQVYVSWDDARLEQLLLAYSTDGGKTWQTLEPFAESEVQPRLGQPLAIPGGETLFLWQDTGSAPCNLYQAPAADVVAGRLDAGEPVLQSLTACPEDARFLPLGNGQVLMVTGSGSDSLTLTVWDGELWSEPTRLGYSFEDPQTERQVYLSGLQVTLVGLRQDETDGSKDRALTVVGIDQNGDVWSARSLTSALDLVFAPRPPWSDPASFAESEGVIGLPAVATDMEGGVHVLWSDEPEGNPSGATLHYARRDQAVTAGGTEVRWTSPTEILTSPDQGASQPSLVAVGDRLHAVWRGGEKGQIFYSQAFVSDAYTASGWDEPQILPAPVAVDNWPDIAADVGGTLHVVYAVPVNEGRGIYYTHSDDGERWSEARQVFDAASAGWSASDHPRLAVDLAGTIHVIWVRAQPFDSGYVPQAVYYAQSLDGGQTWSKAIEVAAGAYVWPEVAVGGANQIHLLWNEAGGQRAWWHQWSSDGGFDWTRPERVPGFGNVAGPAGLLSDGSTTVHLLGLGQDSSGEPGLLYATWDGQRWSDPETFLLNLTMDTPMTGISAALLPALGQLDVVFRGEGLEATGTEYTDLWHARREVPTVVATPVPTFTPRPIPTPLPTATSEMPPTPTPSFNQATPPASDDSADLLPILLPVVVAALIVAGVLGARLLRTSRR